MNLFSFSETMKNWKKRAMRIIVDRLLSQRFSIHKTNTLEYIVILLGNNLRNEIVISILLKIVKLILIGFHFKWYIEIDGKYGRFENLA